MSDEKLTATATFHLNDGTASKEIARIGSDGVWVNPDLPVDEAARKFLDIVNDMWGAHFTKPAVEAERARIRAEVKDLFDRPSTLFGKWAKIDNVLWIIDGEDTRHE
jgi:hypothetical protein